MRPSLRPRCPMTRQARSTPSKAQRAFSRLAALGASIGGSEHVLCAQEAACSTRAWIRRLDCSQAQYRDASHRSCGRSWLALPPLANRSSKRASMHGSPRAQAWPLSAQFCGHLCCSASHAGMRPPMPALTRVHSAPAAAFLPPHRWPHSPSRRRAPSGAPKTSRTTCLMSGACST